MSWILFAALAQATTWSCPYPCVGDPTPGNGTFDLAAVDLCGTQTNPYTTGYCDWASRCETAGGDQYEMVQSCDGPQADITFYDAATGAEVASLRCSDIPQYCGGTSSCIWTGTPVDLCEPLCEYQCGDTVPGCATTPTGTATGTGTGAATSTGTGTGTGMGAAGTGTGATTGTGTGATTGTGTGAGTGVQDTGANGGDKGCGCAGPGPAGTWTWLLGGAALLVRRRQSRAAVASSRSSGKE